MVITFCIRFSVDSDAEDTEGGEAPADNLTRKAIAAEKAGLSYGYYVAQMAMGKLADSEPSRDGGEKAEPEMDRMGRIPCKECGELFYPLRKGNVFCSRACGDRRRSREKYRRKHGFYDKEARSG